ncbi:MAG: Gfo/Idh/MocA family oxidoreductase [Planctomycetota bacterium]|nr:Gfo/Idh/MocA family oxidoreductase [Planctomycetota bacterium]
MGTPYRREIRDTPDDGKIIAVCARRRALLQKAAEDDRAVLATDNWREVVEHPDVNLVIVATPDALHYEPVLECARLGKHVFCEKPIAADVQEARSMWQAIEAAGVAHYVPFWTRYVPVVRKARELVKEGTLGPIKAVIYRWHNPRPPGMPFTWRDDASLSSAGSVADVGSHAYDTMRWLLDDEAKRVLCHADVITPAKPDLGDLNLDEALAAGSAQPTAGTSLKKGTAFDYAAAAIEFNHGTLGSLILSHAPFVRKGLAPDIELHGTEASLGIDRAKSTLTIARQGEEPAILETVADSGFGNRFSRFVFPGLRGRIEGKPTDHPGMDDGYRVQLFTDAAALSARRGTWISLEELNQPQSRSVG